MDEDEDEGMRNPPSASLFKLKPAARSAVAATDLDTGVDEFADLTTAAKINTIAMDAQGLSKHRNGSNINEAAPLKKLYVEGG